MKSLAIIVTRGTTNNLIQVLTLMMASVHEDIRVRVLFRDESVLLLQPGKMNQEHFSSCFQAVHDVSDKLQKLELTDLKQLLQDIKDSGDVECYACQSSLVMCGLESEGLIEQVDSVKSMVAFLSEDMAAADHVLTF